MGCEKEDFDSVTGSWYGTRAYYNPVGGTKYQYLTIKFENNGSGSLEYEAPGSYALAYFSYSIKNGVITCNGGYANTYGDVDDNFNLKLKIEGNRLIPLNKYTVFILTKDNSVMTDGNGEELINNTELLYGVWLHSSGEVVLVLNQSSYTEYTLLSPASNIYSKKTEGVIIYNLLNKYLLINGNKFDLLNLTKTELQIRSEKNVVFNYTRGTVSDIPTNGENSEDYKSILEAAELGWADNNPEINIRFYDSNKIKYMERSSKSLGSWGHVWLDASGTYSVSGKTITCNFNSVYWQSGDSYAKDYFPGWTHNQPCTKKFIIENINVERMTLSIDGKSHYFYNCLLKD